MSDLILNLSSNPGARKVMSMLGLPTPQALRRAEGPAVAKPMTGSAVEIGGRGPALETIAAVAAEAGAEVLQGEPGEGEKIDALVFDATGIEDVDGLRALYDFFHPRARQLARCGRVVVVGRRVEAGCNPSVAAAQGALSGFTKSLAKEVGRRGATANLLTVAPGSEAHIGAGLRFLLSDRAAFISGQPLHISGSAPCDADWTQGLAGKTALVTGAARGIGRATAKRLAAEGARVMCLDIPPEAEALEALAKELNGVAVPLDITADDAAAKLIEAAGGPTVGREDWHLGPIDIVVHNAGITRDRTIAKMDEKWWDLTLSVNLNAVLKVTAELAAEGGIPNDGRVILVSSVAGIAGNVGQTNYAASKSGVVGLVHAFSEDFADRGITVNAVAPGFIETRLTQAIPFTIREVGRRLSNLSQGGIPLDIAEAITFFASPNAGSVNGNVLRVCGGNLLGA